LTRAKVWTSAPGSLRIQAPGDVVRDLARDGTATYRIVVFSPRAVESARCEQTRAVRRALELLRGRLDAEVTLDALADHVGIDKFHLCRAFRAQVGLPPHAYLTRLRILRAKQLLASGVKPIEVAPRVGLYDQSQLNRHFRRLVGTTPGAYAREHAT
jgi:AraC-like DNA-binding protein